MDTTLSIEPAPDETARDEEIKRFFDGWSLYQKLVRNNYMFHCEVYAAVTRFFTANFTGREIDVLDLGAGDAAFMREPLTTLAGGRYLAVDLSGVALELARANLENLPLKLEFLQQDMLSALDALQQAGRHFDVVFSGYALHHLSEQDKQQWLSRVYKLLKPGGHVLLIDTIREEGQSRVNYLAAWRSYVLERWTLLTSDEAAAVIEHVTTQDYPATLTELCEQSRHAGFARVEPLVCKDAWFQCLRIESPLCTG